jgi:hypothetical protein
MAAGVARGVEPEVVRLRDAGGKAVVVARRPPHQHLEAGDVDGAPALPLAADDRVSSGPPA